MSGPWDEDDGSFLRRWSRLKTQAADPPPPPPEAPVPAEPEPVAEEVPDLPPLDSLGADSDYTPFLRKEVPAALRTAALRTAWRSDPKIAGFKGLADYDWDCNAPGYGALLPIDDMRALCERILGPKPEPPGAEGEESGDPDTDAPRQDDPGDLPDDRAGPPVA